jgi:hypothetical protein
MFHKKRVIAENEEKVINFNVKKRICKCEKIFIHIPSVRKYFHNYSIL